MTNRRKDLTNALLHFYEQPVAKVSLELFLTIGLVLFLALFAIRPTLLTMSDLIKEIDDKKELNEKLGRKIAALGSAQSEYLTLESRLGVLDEALPSKPDLVRNLKLIEKIASDNRVLITSISIGEIPPESDDTVPFANLKRQNMTMSVAVVGDYPSIRTFVEKLQESRRAIIVDTVNFTLDEGRNSRRLRATITINLPYYASTSN
jgi:Tfp pilus assembly protein PilO